MSHMVLEIDPMECPFREFRDNELSQDLWGLGPAACRAAIVSGGKLKLSSDHVWVDDQAQPLPRSVRQHLHGWIRAEQLATEWWDAEVTVFEENNDAAKMSILEIQLSHAQVLKRSSFCKKVLSACYMLEEVEDLTVQHQWENFMASYGPEGWRARYHIYSPGMKSGGGQQHRPSLSKNGCYLVRLYHLGAWRCVWVSDQIPVDANDSPLLPFSPLLIRSAPSKPGTKTVVSTMFANVVYLWPLLLCKALLKLAAPDMGKEDDMSNFEDEPMPYFDIMHALTGCMSLVHVMRDSDDIWKLMTTEVPVFSWDSEEDTTASALKTKVKKPIPTSKDTVKSSLATILIEDTKDAPPYLLPGITPGYEMTLMVTMARDLPLKQPLPEPEVDPWKYYRWVDWARRHGLYDEYRCPRTKFLKLTGLLKLSYAPHLVDVVSTESITYGFREQHDKSIPPPPTAKVPPSESNLRSKEELRDWVQFELLCMLLKQINILYFPSLFEITSAASNPPVRITKASMNHAIDIVAPKCAPLYLQIDSSEEICLRLSLAMLHPRILANCKLPQVDYIQPAYLFLEKFDWFVDCEVPTAKAFLKTSGYDSVEVKFQPGRHYCRLWVHSRLNWHVMLLSESSLLLGTRDVIQAASVKECPWAAKFLSNLSDSFASWIRVNRSSSSVFESDKEFFKSYQPDLDWDIDTVGYKQTLLHWMFRQALQSLLQKRLPSQDFSTVCTVLRHYFCDPEFGMLAKPKPSKPLRDIIVTDTCDCVDPESNETEQIEILEEEIPIVIDPALMSKLLTAPTPPSVCEYATDELSCGILKSEREKIVRMHEAATIIQAHWRGAWARICLNNHVDVKPEILKLVMDNAFGTLESLSALMNEFFALYPGAKTAYSVASALTGANGLHQYTGSSNATPRCTWIPFFQGVFFCHAPVKVHFDLQSSIPHSIALVYDNDTGLQMSQSHNSFTNLDFVPNSAGYTVMGHGTLSKPRGVFFDVQWHLTVLSSIDDAFHICDNDIEDCRKQSLQEAYKQHIDELYLPNRKKILGGLLISVMKEEAISFRAVCASPEVNIVATLRSSSSNGNVEELAHCTGKGEIYWPFIQLQPLVPSDVRICKDKTRSALVNVNEAKVRDRLFSKAQSSKNDEKKVTIKFKDSAQLPVAVKQYSIEITAPDGWPLTIGQWKRVIEVRNAVGITTNEVPKKPTEHGPGKGEKVKEVPIQSYIFQPDDAFIEMECSLAVGGGATARRDDLRDLTFQAMTMSWEASEPGRNARGAQIREAFRAKFLEPLPPSESESIASSVAMEMNNEEMVIESHPGPTPVSESGMTEMSMESDEEAKFLLLPEELKDKFIPLDFVPLCMKEKNDEHTALLSNDMAEAAKNNRHARHEAALERMKELQSYNVESMLGRQKRRCKLLGDLSVDSQWCEELADILNQRDEVILREIFAQNQLALKKKQEEAAKKK